MPDISSCVVTLVAGGDIGPIHGPTEQFAELNCRCDLRLGQCERMAQPYAVTSEDAKFQETVDWTEWVSDQHPHKFRVEGSEVVVETGRNRLKQVCNGYFSTHH